MSFGVAQFADPESAWKAVTCILVDFNVGFFGNLQLKTIWNGAGCAGDGPCISGE